MAVRHAYSVTTEVSRFLIVQRTVASSAIYSYLDHCSSMNGWISCASTEPLNSARRFETAWDNCKDVRHMVWIEQNRNDDTESRAIHIATEFVDFNTLPEPTVWQRSNVSPGIACNAYSANNYDCILVYTSQQESSPEGQVVTSRFYTGTTQGQIFLHSFVEHPWSSICIQKKPAF